MSARLGARQARSSSSRTGRPGLRHPNARRAEPVATLRSSAEFVTSAAPVATGSVRSASRATASRRSRCVGRSNVGKSSLINALAGSEDRAHQRGARQDAAGERLSPRVEGGAGGPGRWSVYLVDLPGYGYAARCRTAHCGRRRTSRGAVEACGVDVADELRSCRGSCGSRSGVRRARAARGLAAPGLETRPRRRALAGWRCNVTRHVVATKIDKLSRAERARSLRTIENVFGMTAAAGVGSERRRTGRTVDTDGQTDARESPRDSGSRAGDRAPPAAAPPPAERRTVVELIAR